MKSARVLISGFVQGVGFRHFIRSKAVELDLTGWVKNLPDGKVEALFQGAKERIEKMISLCKKGPFLAEVEEVIFNWEETAETYDSFSII